MRPALAAVDEAPASDEDESVTADVLVIVSRAWGVGVRDDGDLQAVAVEDCAQLQHASMLQVRILIQDEPVAGVQDLGMASIHKHTVIAAPAELVWDALSDWGALPTRLAPGFAVDLRLDGPDRIVTFFNGAVVREVLVSRDDDRRRLAWSIVDGPYTHHHGVARVDVDTRGRTCFTWVADVLPDDAAERTAELMQRGIETVRETLEPAARTALT